MRSLIVVLVVFLMAPTVEAKKKEVIMRKVQKVDFTGETVDGNAQTPDGAYVSQKRGVDFVPLYKVREHFDDNIKSSVEFLK